MSTPNATISYNPTLNHVRSVSAIDASLPTERNRGVNCAEFDEIVLVGTLLGGATAVDVEVYFWSPAKDPNGGFVPAITPISFTFTTSGQRAIVRVAHHKSVWFHVTSITAGAGERLRLEVAGIPAFNRRG